MTSTLGYVAMPRGDVPLRRSGTGSRTQDIPIDDVLTRAAPPALVARAGGPVGPGVNAAASSSGTTPRQTAPDSLIASRALAVGGLDAPAAPRTASAGFPGGGAFGHSPHPTHGGNTGKGFSGGAMNGAAAWGGASGSAHPRSTETTVVTDNSVRRPAAIAPPKAQKSAPGPPAPRVSSPRSTGGTTGRSSEGERVASLTSSSSPTIAQAPPAASVSAPVVTPVGGGIGVGSAPRPPAASGGGGHGVFTGGTSGDTGVPPPVTVVGPGSPAPTPEPITLLLVGTGLAGAYGTRRYFK